jgi:hypothetical protein
MSTVSGIARMNLAAADDKTLRTLRDWFAMVRDHGTEAGAGRAPDWLAAIDEELAARRLS